MGLCNQQCIESVVSGNNSSTVDKPVQSDLRGATAAETTTTTIVQMGIISDFHLVRTCLQTENHPLRFLLSHITSPSFFIYEGKSAGLLE